jgi:hypothetical protein
MDMIKGCMIIDWTYLASSSFVLFSSNLEWLVIDSVHRNASVEAIYPALVAGEDVLRVVHAILV